MIQKEVGRGHSDETRKSIFWTKNPTFESLFMPTPACRRASKPSERERLSEGQQRKPAEKSEGTKTKEGRKDADGGSANTLRLYAEGQPYGISRTANNPP